MKKSIGIFTIAFFVALASVSITATASSLLEDIRAYLNKGIKVTIDGVPWQPQLNGSPLYPITYNGSTYLPVRAVSEALDVPIRWDAEANTVHIGGTSELVPILSEPHIKLSATITEDEQDRKIQGMDYGQVVWFEKILHSTSRFGLEPGAQYTKLVLKMGIEGDDTRIKLINDTTSSEIKSVLLTEADGVVEIEAGITGMQKIIVEVSAEEPNTASTVRIITAESYYTTE